MKEEKFRVLIVDDMEENLRVIGNILGDTGISILMARSGEQAIKTAIQKLPDLVLLDISMPEMDGYEVIQILKENKLTNHIPVIFLTARVQTSDLVKGFELGAIDYITKPFNQHELLSRIFTHLELKKSRDTIEKQKSELQRTNKILLYQKDKIENQHKNILESIGYAKVIQNAVLPSDSVFKYILPKSFILYLPKDIVSGDFYWIKKIGTQTIVVTADCTGHGVPGAFMSMLGLALLNKIFSTISCNTLLNAAELLNELRENLIHILNVDREHDITSDGIDMVLCIMDVENKRMQYAGANSPLYIVRRNKNTTAELIQYKPDRMPVGIYMKEKPFVNNIIQIEEGDIVYSFSDGYVDQFGGPNGRKFYSKTLRDYILSICYEPLASQRRLLHNEFLYWKGSLAQIDDVLVVGFKITNEILEG